MKGSMVELTIFRRDRSIYMILGVGSIISPKGESILRHEISRREYALIGISIRLFGVMNQARKVNNSDTTEDLEVSTGPPERSVNVECGSYLAAFLLLIAR